jgi:hypothetical protein
MENGHPGYKYRKYFEDMRKKLRVDEKIQQEYGLKIDTRKLEEKILLEKEETGFDELEDDRITRFRRIFKNAYHKIILTIFNTIILLKKNQRDYSIVFRFFGHTDEDIKEFIYEFNSFCEGKHPRYCGNHGDLKRFDGSKNTRDYRIYSFDKYDNVAVLIRNEDPNKETLVLETFTKPDNNNIEELRDNIEEFYEDENTESLPPILRGRNNIYLSLQEKLSQFLSFVLVDDYSYFLNGLGGKLFLVDPYDYETLQIFFDYDLDKHPEKIQIVDIVTGKTIDSPSCLNKFIVNVEPRKAIIEQSYFVNKIEICEKRRIEEIQAIGIKSQINVLTTDYDYDEEVRKIPTDKYLEMTILPLLSTVYYL